MEFNGPSGRFQIALMFLLGLATIGYGGYSYAEQSSALDSAVEVDATISSTSVEADDARRGTDYVPRATFNYTYEGETYTATNVYPGELPRDFSTREKARSQLKGYEPGDTVTAYVPTDSPGQAFLKHESSDKPLLVVGFGVLFVLASLYSFLTD
ncbi:DUF3592 domain-containing protein [Halomicrococcus gelatinilyticus]|uniref:DUF3592 domain-containing protein n=1 Tax=Halomicrococcus gelatinilyticus TaxID=1702103 RepID=UPI002E0EFD09